MGRLKDWDQRIAAAQLERTYVIGGVPVRRIPYGAERTRWRLPKCGDCDVRKGQLHVVGCDIEECPACGWQVISCGCLDCEH
jgi:hypothetical protein